MLKDLAYLWDIIGLAGRKQFYIVMTLVVVMALLETAGVLSVTPFLAALANPERVYQNPLAGRISALVGVESPREFLVLLGVLSMLVVVCSAVFKSVTIHLLNRYAQLRRYHISTYLLGTYLQQPYAFHLNRNSSDLKKTLLSEVDQFVGKVLQPLMLMVAHGMVILAMMVVLLVYDARMAVVVVGCVGAFYAAIFLMVRGFLDRAGFERHVANRKRYRACEEALGGVKEVKAMNASGLFMSRFAEASREFSRHIATGDTLSQSPLYLVECLGFSVIVGLAVVLMMRGDNLSQVLPAIGLYAFAAYRMLPAAQNVYRGVTRIRSGMPALGPLHDDLGLDVSQEPAPAEAANRSTLSLTRAVAMRGVGFRYPESGAGPSLEDIDLEIPAGQSIGIIGSTGSGKSTLIDLLLGLLVPDHGEIWVDDVRLTPDRMVAWRAAIGYVPQQIFLTDSTIAENIAFGVPPDRIDAAQVQRAARAAQLHDFIRDRLRGVRISGGERQRLGLARALYREPSVLLLDEATSALDVATEASVLAAVNELRGSRTIIMVAHRLSTVEHCDAVILLDRGRIEAIGPPASVIARARELWRSDSGGDEPVESLARLA